MKHTEGFYGIHQIPKKYFVLGAKLAPSKEGIPILIILQIGPKLENQLYHEETRASS